MQEQEAIKIFSILKNPALCMTLLLSNPTLFITILKNIVDLFPNLKEKEPEIFILCEEYLSKPQDSDSADLSPINFSELLNPCSTLLSSDTIIGHQKYDRSTMGHGFAQKIGLFLKKYISNPKTSILDVGTGNQNALKDILANLPDLNGPHFSTDIMDFPRVNIHNCTFIHGTILDFLSSIRQNQHLLNDVIIITITSPPPGYGIEILFLVSFFRMFRDLILSKKIYLCISGELGAGDGIGGLLKFLITSPSLELIASEEIWNKKFVIKNTHLLRFIVSNPEEQEEHDGHLYKQILDAQEQHDGHLYKQILDAQEPICGFCSTLNTPENILRKCSACNIVYYCNKECQTKHWKDHKKKCRKAKSSSLS